MYLILTAIVVAAIMSVVLLRFGDDGYSDIRTACSVLGFLLGICSGVCAIVYVFLVWHWISANYQAQIINREYGTNYTQAEVFYARDVIETVRQLERKRYEINGDFRRGREAKP